MTVGTCKMGDPTTVVSSNDLKVKGFANLRIVDASVMPTVPSGNTNAPTIMIGEVASEMIKGRCLLLLLLLLLLLFFFLLILILISSSSFLTSQLTASTLPAVT
ncbi:GMC oxidoreductase-domain-containing protein [Zopfochytrium polystomum]|nr:GMC oxidoreductase-domain-containing protein [Zopfochytrium polystomum]